MRHGKKFNHLGRKAPHRKAMLANMASSLLKYKRINTTVAKAKALRTFIEPLLTKAKNDTTHSRRMVFRYLRDKYAVTELFRDVAPKIGDRPGGYTRILKTGNRMGDNAEMCFIELVDFNETMLSEPKSTTGTEKKPRTRRGRKKGGSDKAEDKPAVKAEAKKDTSSDESTEASAEEETTVEVKEESSAKEEKPEAEEVKDEEVKDEEAKVEETPEETSDEPNAEAETAEEGKEEVKEEAETKDETPSKEEEESSEESSDEEASGEDEEEKKD